MNRKITGFLAAILILAAPSAHAGFAGWISDHLPQSWQVSREYRDEVKYMKRQLGITVPIIFININHPTTHAGMTNLGVGSLRYAIMFINEKSFSTGRKAYNTRALAHELKHIELNHGDDTMIFKEEWEADEGSFAFLQKLGYHKALEEEYAYFKQIARYVPLYERPAEKEYPALITYLTWAKEACEACRKNPNQSNRPNTLHLIKNGSPSRSTVRDNS